MRVEFTKMHGLGNDFVVIDAIRQHVDLTEAQYRFLADRRLGIGCDQILLVESPRTPDTEFFYRIFNADGSEVEQCGNGARCFARFVRDKGLSSEARIRVGTRSGTIVLTFEPNGDVRVKMGAPVLDPDRIPFRADARKLSYTLDVGEETFDVGAVSMGNPHVVLRVEHCETAPVETLGPLLESHPRFPYRANAGFMQIVDPDHIRLRVYERGVGETLACGTGACAAVVSGILQGLLHDRVVVSLPGGDLVIEWSGGQAPVWMSGPATTVYEGKIEL